MLVVTDVGDLMIAAPTLTTTGAQMSLPSPHGAPGQNTVDPESSLALVIRARAGDERALNDLFERYSARLRVWAHGRLPPWARGPADTHDLVQDTLLQVIRKLDTFEPRHEGAFLGYVRMALRNNITDRIRHVRRWGLEEPLATSNASPEPSPYELAVGSELQDRYEAALARLRPDYAEVIFVRIELQSLWPEVAQALNRSIPAVQMLFRRALVCLAREMSQGQQGLGAAASADSENPGSGSGLQPRLAKPGRDAVLGTPGATSGRTAARTTARTTLRTT
jgi:RNA polymerase sigma factor (sigma-70 family)